MRHVLLAQTALGAGRGVQKLRSELAEHSLFKRHHGPYRIGLAKSKELRNQKSYYYRQL